MSVKTLILGIVMICVLPLGVKAQLQSTRIVRLEVDGKEVKKSYRIFFLSEGRWIEGQRNGDRFTVPSAVQNAEYVTLLITFGKYRLEFERLHTSNFTVDWVVGVDKKPFSEEFAKLDDDERVITEVYYLEFEGEPDRLLTITKWKRRSR